MDPVLAKIIDTKMPKLNRNTADGLATKHLAYAEQHVDSLLRSIAVHFPPDLVYEGICRVTPLEEYRETTRRKNNSNGGTVVSVLAAVNQRGVFASRAIWSSESQLSLYASHVGYAAAKK